MIDLTQVIKLLGQPTKRREPLPPETWIDARRRCWRITERWQWTDLGRHGTDDLRRDVIGHALVELVRRWSKDGGRQKQAMKLTHGGDYPKIAWSECRFAVRRGVRKLCTGLVGKLPVITDSPDGRQAIRMLSDGTLRAKNMLALDPLVWRSRDELTLASPSETEAKRAVELGNLINGSIKLAYSALGLGTITDSDIPKACVVLSFVAPELWAQIESIAGVELL